ncbi:MAG: carbohydrate-binding protein [Fibrobacteraceae bacterium]|nr:carbohydrate-binding protein [Fibrobacteraceae bacterium]
MDKKNEMLSFCTGIIFLTSPIFADFSLSVDLSDSIRPVTHCASGSLYGMTESLPSDIQTLVAPLNPHAFNQPAISGSGHQQMIGDAIKVSERLSSTTAMVQIRLADILPSWPYKWPGQSKWLASVKSIIESKLASGRSNYDGYEIWNEPDGTWQSTNGDFYTTVWKPTYDLIRSLDPNAKIIGPSYSYYNNNSMSAFLTYCKTNNCLPDVISWHQWGSEGFIGAVGNLKALEKNLGITERPLSINEYSSNTHTYEGAPGISVPFIAKFERNNVESAMISWWFTALPGRLGSLLTASNAKGGGWWLYKWYGDMTGYMANVTPPNDKSDGVDAFAAVDTDEHYASIILGGNSIGTTNVSIKNIPDIFGEEVYVKLEYVSWVNKDTEVASTNEVSTTKYTVTNGAVSVPVNITSQFYGYRVYITPAAAIVQEPYADTLQIPGMIEAENYDVGGQGISYSDNESTNQGGVYRENGVDIVTITNGYAVGYTIAGEWLEYTVNIEKAGIYTYEALVASESGASSFRLFLDDAPITDTIKVTKTGNWNTYNSITGRTSNLSAGSHVLKIAITGNYVNIDNIKITEGTTYFTEAESSISEKTQTFKIYNIKGTYLGKVQASSTATLKAELGKSNLNSGIYFAHGNTMNKFVEVKK